VKCFTELSNTKARDVVAITAGTLLYKAYLTVSIGLEPTAMEGINITGNNYFFIFAK
jgi:hypothetical protein